MLAACALAAADYQAGTARVEITSHVRPSASRPLWARALALEDGKGSGVLIISADVAAYRRELAELVAARVQKEYGLERAGVLLSACGSEVAPAAGTAPLADALLTAAGAALGALKPASLFFSGTPAVSVLAVREEAPARTPGGSLLAALFSAENSGPEDERAAAFETAHPGALALVLGSCVAPASTGPGQNNRESGFTRALENATSRIAGPLRAVFRAVDTSRTFSDRDEQPIPQRTLYPVQVIRIGRGIMIVAFGGRLASADLARVRSLPASARSLLITGCANGPVPPPAAPVPESAFDALGAILKRLDRPQ